MIGEDVKVINYSRKIDFYNTVTHAVGIVFGVIALVMMIIKANNVFELASAWIYGIALIDVYTVSSVYHALKPGEKKRKARLLDHSTVPVLIAGTATPCALITLQNISPFHSIFVFSLAWGCTVFGIVSKLFFFNKLKNVTMAVYIISCSLMLLSVVPLLGQINGGAFGKLIFGCIFYLIGIVLCALGAKREWLHPIFHIFVLIGSAFHFYVIYNFVF